MYIQFKLTYSTHMCMYVCGKLVGVCVSELFMLRT